MIVQAMRLPTSLALLLFIFIAQPAFAQVSHEPILAKRGTLILNDDFTIDRAKGWVKLPGGSSARAGAAEWKKMDGFYRSGWHPGSGHAPVMVYQGDFTNVVVQCVFRCGEITEDYHHQCFRLALDNRELYTGHVLSAWANQNNDFIDTGLLLQHIRKTPEKVVLADLRLDKRPIHLVPGKWYTATLEVVKDQVLYRVQGEDEAEPVIASAQFKELNVPKLTMSITLGTTPHDLKSLKVWKAKPNPQWEVQKDKLLSKRKMANSPGQ
ncbi:MAG: hypothetical protein COA78_07285 [Blastopirellula sp.]|nr:MAG: hypothetical protein COA78_07285 [Blastopirellula sp.]